MSQSELDKWKARHGLDRVNDRGGETNQDEIRMIAEDRKSKGKSWCFECDAHMKISQMKLITRSIDSYCQMSEAEGDYIPSADRVRMCPECFEQSYPKEP